ncbi:MAG TPA: glycerol-3-phosphate dehydrogenase/oxidase [Thermoanaerobaculia bacterium]
MNRDALLARLTGPWEIWDVLVVGGGATGLGAAVEAASRGYRTALIEASDFAKGSSSRSTKLIHGGVRYLQQGHLPLVFEALRERGLLLRNAPHLVRELSFVVPRYDWWEGPFYGMGLKLYDLLARGGLGPSRALSREETLDRVPTLEPKGLRGGILYQDAQFDDARLALTLARTLVDLGGVAVNYARATALIKEEAQVRGAMVRDEETGGEHEVRARVVINATGVFADGLRRLDDAASPDLLAPSQGIHLVLDRRFQPGESAILVPHTDDGRVLFAVPWLDRVIVGTTDTPVAEPSLEPRPLPEEVEFLLRHAARYLVQDPRPEDVLSCFAGLRPLVRGGRDRAKTAALSRDHTLLVSASGLVTITGGKWTTYRSMGEDAVDRAAAIAGLEERPSATADLHLHGWIEDGRPDAAWSEYGADAPALARLAAERPGLDEPLHFNLPYRACEVVWAVRHEMARTVEDVLARRTRALLLDARASAAIAPDVAGLMAAELGRDEAWQRRQVEAYRKLARGYWL